MRLRSLAWFGSVASLLSALSAPAFADNSDQSPANTPADRYFLPYDGAPTMRLFGIAIASDGPMYVVGGDLAAVGTDGYLSQVKPDGTEQRLVDFKARFVGPGMDLDQENNVYLSAGDQILRISAAGDVETIASGFVGAIDVRRDPRGNLYVADHREAKIYRITPGMERSVIVDYHSAPGAFLINSLAFDREYAHLYTFEKATQTIWRYPVASDGSVGAPEAFMKNAPLMISFDLDADGNLFGADFQRGEIVKIDRHGNLTYVTDGCGLKHPIGFRLGKAGFHPNTAFVADAEGIKRIPLTGAAAGTPQQ